MTDKGLEFAWRVHAALDSWTGKVDTKASIALAIESAIFGFVVTLSKRGERFADLHAADLALYRIGVGFLLLSILLSLLVVMPQLNRRESRRIWRTNKIYFGHLRHWDPTELAKELRKPSATEQQLAQQLVTMSKIAWRKHARLQWSLAALVAGATSLLIVAI